MKRLALLALIALAVIMSVSYQWLAATIDEPLGQAGVWHVERGSSLHGVMGQLQPGVNKHQLRAQRALLRWREQPLDIKAGEYRLSPIMSLTAILEMFAAGNVIARQATLLEGWTISQAKTYLATVDGLQNDLEGQAWQAFLLSLNLSPEQHGEGWFAPETYHFSLGNKQSDILRQAHQRLRGWLDEAWQQRRDGLPLAQPYDMLILASIVEKETALAAERGTIASVFLNRLRRGMRLQTDPTVIYGLGEAFDGDLRRRDLASDSPYNTYRINGLPPTPIALPSRDALLAVALAPDTPYLYFVAKGDGSSYFSTSLEEHQAAVRRYQINRRSDYRSRPAQGSVNER